MTIEFGSPVRNTFRFSGAPEQKRMPSTNLGRVILGKATAYTEWHHAMTGLAEVFVRGCFAESLKSRPVEFLLDHDSKQKLGSTEDGRLELCDSSDGLWFRFFPANQAKHLSVVSEVEDGGRTQMSVGYAVIEDEILTSRDGTKARMICKAILGEISLVRTDHAAVKSTQAFLANSSEISSLAREVSTGRLAELASIRCPLAVLRGKILGASP